MAVHKTGLLQTSICRRSQARPSRGGQIFDFVSSKKAQTKESNSQCSTSPLMIPTSVAMEFMRRLLWVRINLIPINLEPQNKATLKSKFFAKIMRIQFSQTTELVL